MNIIKNTLSEITIDEFTITYSFYILKIPSEKSHFLKRLLFTLAHQTMQFLNVVVLYFNFKLLICKTSDKFCFDGIGHHLPICFVSVVCQLF